jgi:hypothetical protein
MRPKEVPQQQQPSEMTINVRGQQRKYYYVKTVESMEELETFRFKVRSKNKNNLFTNFT